MKRSKKQMSGQILKLLGRMYAGVKGMTEDIAVLTSKVDKIAETSCLHFKPTFYVDNDVPKIEAKSGVNEDFCITGDNAENSIPKYGCTLF
jgi:hypothetical protein